MIQIVFIICVVLGITIAARRMESKHLQWIRLREQKVKRVRVSPAASLEGKAIDTEQVLVFASMVISADPMLRFRFALRALFGGRMDHFDLLFQRARREVLLRLKENSLARGFEEVINLRFDNTALEPSAHAQWAVSRFEVLAYGTAIRRKK